LFIRPEYPAGGCFNPNARPAGGRAIKDRRGEADADEMAAPIAIGVATALGAFAIFASVPRCVGWYTRRREFRRWEKIRGN
jgi:hypothetical protein